MIEDLKDTVQKMDAAEAGYLRGSAAAKQEEVDAWEEELEADQKIKKTLKHGKLPRQKPPPEEDEGDYGAADEGAGQKAGQKDMEKKQAKPKQQKPATKMMPQKSAPEDAQAKGGARGGAKGGAAEQGDGEDDQDIVMDSEGGKAKEE